MELALKKQFKFVINQVMIISRLISWHQKFTQIQSKNSTARLFRFNKFVLNQKSKKNIKYVTCLAQNTLWGHTVYNFLEKLVTIISFYDYLVKIKRNFIQLSMAMLLLRLFLKIQNHFKNFEHIWGFDITILLQSTCKMRLSFCGVVFCKSNCTRSHT